jgi:hypothetical protein
MNFPDESTYFTMMITQEYQTKLDDHADHLFERPMSDIFAFSKKSVKQESPDKLM